MFPFDPPENIRKIFGFMMFSGGSKLNIGNKWVNQMKNEIFKIVSPINMMIQY